MTVAPTAPLAGIRVLDLTRLFPFSYGTQLLVDLGAEVVKVEAPEGEVGRAYSGPYRASNRGKRSVAVDLRTDAGRAALLDLVGTADVVVESFRPGYLDGLGLGPSRLRAARPGLVVCSVSGYAADGPRARTPGHDLNYLAVAGGALPHAGSPPAVPALPVIDMVVGHHLSHCISAALLGVARGGSGCHIEISMADLALSLSTSTLALALAGGAQAVPFPEFVLDQVPAYRVWRVADGWISLCNLEPKFWRAFLEVVDRLDLVDDGLATGERGNRVVAELAAILAARSTGEWAEAFAGREVCFAPVHDPAAAVADPEFATRGLVRRIDGGVEVLFPATFDGVRPGRSEALAAVGADADLLA
ncbi:MAG TPA: CoA transferase [Iamia sp.]|nr:CoA transferase [Iamia sp.]